MARRIADKNLDSKDARRKLQPRGKPYWRSVERGLHLGYRRLREKRWPLASGSLAKSSPADSGRSHWRCARHALRWLQQKWYTRSEVLTSAAVAAVDGMQASVQP